MKKTVLTISSLLCLGTWAIAQTKPAPARLATPAAKPGVPGKPGQSATKTAPIDTLWMRDKIKSYYTDCYTKKSIANSCDSAIYWGQLYFATVKSEDPNAAYYRCLAAFHKFNNILFDETQKSKGKSTSGIKNTDAAIAAMPKERKAELLKIAESAKGEMTWYTQVYNTEEKSMFRLGDVTQKMGIIDEYIKKLNK
jgi:hypothetical protein